MAYVEVKTLEQLQRNQASDLDVIGYCPVIGSIVGLGRAACAIVLLVSAIFVSCGQFCSSEKAGQDYLKMFRDSLLHLFRGTIEVIPFIGGAITKSYDENIRDDSAFDQGLFNGIGSIFSRLVEYQKEPERKAIWVTGRSLITAKPIRNSGRTGLERTF